MDGHLYVFVNERSFEGQFQQPDVAEGLVQFLRSINRLSSIGNEHFSVYYQSCLYNCYVTHDLTFASALRKTTGIHRDEIMRLKLAMNVQGWKKIEDEGFMQEFDRQYYVGNNNVSGSSLAEAFEYEGVKEEKNSVLLINFPQSPSFQGVIVVSKVEDIIITRALDSITIENEVINYLVNKGVVFEYDPKSTLHPLPEQTILKDSTLFAKTKRTNMGAYLYERIGHNELWCLDTFHVDGDAHFEIFSMINDRWIGECCDLQAINPDYHSNKHRGSKIRDH